MRAGSTMRRPALSHCLRSYEPDFKVAGLEVLVKIGDALK